MPRGRMAPRNTEHLCGTARLDFQAWSSSYAAVMGLLCWGREGSPPSTQKASVLGSPVPASKGWEGLIVRFQALSTFWQQQSSLSFPLGWAHVCNGVRECDRQAQVHPFPSLLGLFPSVFRPLGNELLGFLFLHVSISKNNGQVFEYEMLCNFFFFYNILQMSPKFYVFILQHFICFSKSPYNQTTYWGFYIVRTLHFYLKTHKREGKAGMMAIDL